MKMRRMKITMSNPNFKAACKFNPSVKCFVESSCIYINELECLQTQILSLQQDNKSLKHKRFLIHDRTSLKWRDQAFYFKKRYKILVRYLTKKDIEIPNLTKLEKELSDENLPLSSKENTPNTDGIADGERKPEQTNNPS
jgi:hypothetical protein